MVSNCAPALVLVNVVLRALHVNSEERNSHETRGPDWLSAWCPDSVLAQDNRDERV